MNVADTADKIIERLQADTGSGGLFDASATDLISAVYYAWIPESNTSPYCYVTFAGERSADAFTRNNSEVIFRVTTVVPRTHLTISPWDPTFQGSKILERVYGSSTAGSLSPTYGLHRWQPTLTLTGWTATAITYEQTFEEHSDNEMVWAQEFKLWVNR